MPGWGGYDYSHLAAALDVIEMSNAGNSVEVARSLVPRLITVTTSAVADPQQIHAIWHQLLLASHFEFANPAKPPKKAEGIYLCKQRFIAIANNAQRNYVVLVIDEAQDLTFRE